ncbi:3-phenylpropionate/trans-cinnamate dioxygenase ferredoxin subunit [Paenibacillus rhizosphaerae]|uniref:3-phenylpropionate/trans-cinnamate dioxygenase ferredoxin subunit n=1 Tax=Paenibacillus rhizosphaerae TaxID=297318 RepID=A0A839TIF7_9BACL|nr:Rieske (2Fe-2S) protein [Paenibacillus rhizosphaerae]MBB3125540.1 3-phenylpropionate/trans-cinnamate dioxygenase ferredoxin subunit [Paenibacillus rhizosphaerae]
MGRHVIGAAADLPPGKNKIVTVEGRSVGVFNVNGSYYALKNACPHQGAPLCMGRVTGMTLPSEPGQYLYGRDGEILRCPWHGWEFDITNGKSIFDPHKCLVKTYKVAVEEESIEEESPSVETYEVKVEDAKIVVYI